MTDIATCGHEVEDAEGRCYWWPSLTRECEPAWAYGVLCDNCAKSYGASTVAPAEIAALEKGDD